MSKSKNRVESLPRKISIRDANLAEDMPIRKWPSLERFRTWTISALYGIDNPGVGIGYNFIIQQRKQDSFNNYFAQDNLLILAAHLQKGDALKMHDNSMRVVTKVGRDKETGEIEIYYQNPSNGKVGKRRLASRIAGEEKSIYELIKPEEGDSPSIIAIISQWERANYNKSMRSQDQEIEWIKSDISTAHLPADVKPSEFQPRLDKGGNYYTINHFLMETRAEYAEVKKQSVEKTLIVSTSVDSGATPPTVRVVDNQTQKCTRYRFEKTAKDARPPDFDDPTYSRVYNPSVEQMKVRQLQPGDLLAYHGQGIIARVIERVGEGGDRDGLKFEYFDSTTGAKKELPNQKISLGILLEDTKNRFDGLIRELEKPDTIMTKAHLELHWGLPEVVRDPKNGAFQIPPSRN